jgi:hypothetical protein
MAASTIRLLQADLWYFCLLRLNGLRTAKNLVLEGTAPTYYTVTLCTSCSTSKPIHL